jgi:hypothetical protein
MTSNVPLMLLQKNTGSHNHTLKTPMLRRSLASSPVEQGQFHPHQLLSSLQEVPLAQSFGDRTRPPHHQNHLKTVSPIYYVIT